VKEITILVIEDNEMNMKLIKEVLKSCKYRTLEATDAETGLCLVREHHPDLILMDIQLPGMDGLSASKIIKTDPELMNIPIFALTGFAMEMDKAKAADIGLDDYIVKPFSVKGLREKLANYFSSHQAEK
jgi:CheY-like chemotaxis protein